METKLKMIQKLVVTRILERSRNFSYNALTNLRDIPDVFLEIVTKPENNS